MAAESTATSSAPSNPVGAAAAVPAGLARSWLLVPGSADDLSARVAASVADVVVVDLEDGVGVIVGIDRFMSEARALTNFTGNAVATVLIGTWTKQLDREQLRGVLAGDRPFDEATMSVDDHLSPDERAEVEREERPSTAAIAAIVGDLDDEKAGQDRGR